MTTYGESGRPNYSENFTPTTQNLLDHGFKTYDLRNYERLCECGEIRYSQKENAFYQRKFVQEWLWKIEVRSLEEMKAYICAMDEKEI